MQTSHYVMLTLQFLFTRSIHKPRATARKATLTRASAAPIIGGRPYSTTSPPGSRPRRRSSTSPASHSLACRSSSSAVACAHAGRSRNPGTRRTAPSRTSAGRSVTGTSSRRASSSLTMIAMAPSIRSTTQIASVGPPPSAPGPISSGTRPRSRQLRRAASPFGFQDPFAFLLPVPTPECPDPPGCSPTVRGTSRDQRHHPGSRIAPPC